MPDAHCDDKEQVPPTLSEHVVPTNVYNVGHVLYVGPANVPVQLQVVVVPATAVTPPFSRDARIVHEPLVKSGEAAPYALAIEATWYT